MAGDQRSGLIASIRETLHNWRLILQRVRKPDREEYIQASKIIWLAILLVGSVAYILHFIAVKILAG